MQTLADNADFNTLQTLEIGKETEWFEEDRDGCMEPLLVLLARQTNLQKLEMNAKCLSEAQQQQIRQVITENTPQCEIKFVI